MPVLKGTCRSEKVCSCELRETCSVLLLDIM